MVKPKSNPTPVFGIEKISPEEAHEVLESRNQLNRPLQKGRVTMISLAIQNGEWQLNGETIKFDTDNMLIDGQHRLAAILDAGVVVETAVMRNLPREAQETVDIGAKRTLGNVLAMRGFADPNNLAAAGALCWRYEEKHLPRTGASDDPTPGEVIDYVSTHGEALQRGITVARNLNQLLKSMNISTGAAAQVIMARKNRAAADDFMFRLGTGAELASRSPILVLRNRLLKDQNEKRKMSKYEVLAITLKAWNAYRADQPVEVLAWKKTESYPRAN